MDELKKGNRLILLAFVTSFILYTITRPWLERRVSEVPLESSILFSPTQTGDTAYNGVRSNEPIQVGDTVAIRINQRPLAGDDEIKNLERYGLVYPPTVEAYATKVVALEGHTVSIDGMRKGVGIKRSWSGYIIKSRTNTLLQISYTARFCVGRGSVPFWKGQIQPFLVLVRFFIKTVRTFDDTCWNGPKRSKWHCYSKTKCCKYDAVLQCYALRPTC